LSTEKNDIFSAAINFFSILALLQSYISDRETETVTKDINLYHNSLTTFFKY